VLSECITVNHCVYFTLFTALLINSEFLLLVFRIEFQTDKFSVMAVRDRDQFTNHLLESSKDPVFIEFLQQLFPWVICNPYGPSPGKRYAGIEWAINEITQFLYAAQNYSEGSVRLVRSSPDRPRGSFSNLLHGQNTTVRLRVKLQYFILESFHFARPDNLIVQQEWRQEDTSSHANGVFIGCLVLWHTDSHTKTAALSEDGGYSETLVYLRLDSPDNQGHLPGFDRDVDIFMKVERGDDMPSLYSSQATSSKSEDSCSDASGDPLVRLNAMSAPSKIAAVSDSSSSCDSDSTLRYDPSQDKELVFHDPLVRLTAMSAPASKDSAAAADEVVAVIPIESLQRKFSAGSICGEVGNSATSSKAIELPWATYTPQFTSRINSTAGMMSEMFKQTPFLVQEKGLRQENAPCINVSTDGKFFQNMHSMGTSFQVAPPQIKNIMTFFFHYLFPD